MKLNRALVFEKVRETLLSELDFISSSMKDLVEGSADESKSSAGDKHEVSRAMMQLEQEKLSRRLQETENQMKTLIRLKEIPVSAVVISGHLVLTDRGYFFIAVPAGKITVEKDVVFCISPSSPLGKAMIGKDIGSEISVNGMVYRIMDVD